MKDARTYQLRRQERTITDPNLLRDVLETTASGRVGVIAGGEPYVVPMNYYYVHEQNLIIIHGANQGRLYTALQDNPRVCFEVDEFLSTTQHPSLCDYGTSYVSIICTGSARIVENLSERTELLRLLSGKYAPEQEVNDLKETTVEGFPGAFESRTAVVVIDIDQMTGKFKGVTMGDSRYQPGRSSELPDLKTLGNVAPGYIHHDRAIVPGRPLVSSHAVFKWYSLRRGQDFISSDDERLAREQIASELATGNIDPQYGLGFVIHHVSTEQMFLIAGVWKENQELWETLYTRDPTSDSFERVVPGVDAPTLCAWELAPVWHERQAWTRFLYSARADRDKHLYIQDQLTGMV